MKCLFFIPLSPFGPTGSLPSWHGTYYDTRTLCSLGTNFSWVISAKLCILFLGAGSLATSPWYAREARHSALPPVPPTSLCISFPQALPSLSGLRETFPSLREIPLSSNLSLLNSTYIPNLVGAPQCLAFRNQSHFLFFLDTCHILPWSNDSRRFT